MIIVLAKAFPKDDNAKNQIIEFSKYLIENSKLEEGNIVFCKVHGNYYTHLILKIKGSGDSTRYQIGNNKGNVNGWIPKSKIFGIVVKIHS